MSKKIGGRPAALTAPEQAQMAALWLSGTSTQELAERFKVSASTVRNLLRKSGVTAEMRDAIGSAGVSDNSEAILADYAALDDPGTNVLECMSWLHEALMISARHVTSDPNYVGNEAQRRKELRDIASAMAKVLPGHTMNKATKALEKDSRELERGAGPQMERVPRRPKRGRRPLAGDAPEHHGTKRGGKR